MKNSLFAACDAVVQDEYKFRREAWLRKDNAVLFKILDGPLSVQDVSGIEHRVKKHYMFHIRCVLCKLCQSFFKIVKRGDKPL